jgi:hypothetical protein
VLIVAKLFQAQRTRHCYAKVLIATRSSTCSQTEAVGQPYISYCDKNDARPMSRMSEKMKIAYSQV